MVTFSTGNFAQAVAHSGTLLGIPTTIVMPEDAPLLKQNATKSYGGNVVLFNRYTEKVDQVAKKILETNSDMVYVPSHENLNVIAAQGTAAKELFEEVGHLDFLFVCVGFGGLLASSSLVAAELSPGCVCYGVEPEAGNDAQQSMRAGQIVTIVPGKTIADGAATPYIGKPSFEIFKKHVKEILTVTDDQLVQEMKFFGQTMKLVVEPTGCLGLAALRNCGIDVKGKRVGVFISGGNVDLTKYANLLL